MNRATSLPEIQSRLRSLASPETARVLQGFFKTGPGQYGEGDEFLGIKVPMVRAVAKEFPVVNLDIALELLHSRFHEERLLAVLLLMRLFSAATAPERHSVFQAYLAHSAWINNWDLVDISAPHVVGAYLAGQARAPLYQLARSASLWERRIAMVATLHFIRHNDFGDTLQLAKLLLNDKEDLMHKASGWMLREVGKRDRALLEAFLDRHGRSMPRTMLRYAIERFPEDLRQAYLRR
ncbi:MAG: DNA alkylation repair protein [Sulfurimicrobium sp.]|nr:DNA alkylation repair protein [Sulfurimicrobium sp.]MDZ7655826.1 DNA alkylation repair protein [Sulfurimicrobium sp.]